MRDIAAGHILIRTTRTARAEDVERAAQALGLSRRGQVYRSRWYTFSLPPGADPRATARAAAALPGVAQATVDPVVTLLDHVQPRDPLYLPADGGCDPFVDVCANQWGLFTAGATTGWHETTGASSVVIAVLDSGVDLDHDDLFANIWQNPGEVAANGIDDGKEPQPHVPMGAAGRQQENKQSSGEGQIDPGMKKGRLVKSAQKNDRRPDGNPGYDQKPPQKGVPFREVGGAEAQEDRRGQKSSAQSEHPSKLFLQVQPGETQEAA